MTSSDNLKKELAELEAANAAATSWGAAVGARSERIKEIRRTLGRTEPNNKIFIVAYVDWSNYELLLERCAGPTWQDAVIAHSKYPFMKCNEETGEQLEPAECELVDPSEDEETFKQKCFDCDCMMSWLEIAL